MKDLSRIIEIDGIKYSIDRTFSNEPAIYEAQSFQKIRHISENPTGRRPGLATESGTVKSNPKG